MGALIHHFVDVLPTYACMIFCVVAVKCLGIMPGDMEDAARVWGQFAIKAWTYACLAGIGFVLIDLETILHTLTPLYLIAVVSISAPQERVTICAKGRSSMRWELLSTATLPLPPMLVVHIPAAIADSSG